MRCGLGIISKFGVASIPTVVLFALELKLISIVLSIVFALVKFGIFFVPFLSRLQSFSFIPSFKSILFPLANFPDSRLSVYHYFLASILFFIWQSRNLATFDNRLLNSRNIVNLIIKAIRTRILGESISRVKEIWSVNNVICSVNRDLIVFHLD